jgi:uncharacterized SAM-binding protein YcdF (DUF218 family)
MFKIKTLFNWVRSHFRRILALGALLLLGVALVSAWQVVAHTELNPAAHGDAAVVLGAAVYREQPSPVFRERINHAIELYQAGQVGAIIFTGGVGSGDTLAESEAARSYAVAAGVPQEDIWIETTSRNTYQNLAQAGILAQTQGFETLVIVSDPLHMSRAMAIAEELDLQAVSSPTPTTRYQSWEPKFSFFLREVYFLSLYRLFPNALGVIGIGEALSV